MTVSNTNRRSVTVGDGTTTTFPYNFLIPVSGQEVVTFTNTAGVPTVLNITQYSITGFGNSSGGTVTYPLIGSPIVAPASITITSNVPATQTLAITNDMNALNQPHLIEVALDNLTMMVQQLGQGGPISTSQIYDYVSATNALIAAQSGVSLQPYDAQLSSLIRQNSQSADYTLVATDSGKHIYHPPADTTARTWTIPANASVPFAIGTAVTFDNDFGAGAVTIAITSDTLVLVGTVGSTGSRTLASGGQATAIKVTATRWRISGVGLS